MATKKPRTAAQQAAFKKMVAANKARRAAGAGGSKGSKSSKGSKGSKGLTVKALSKQVEGLTGRVGKVERRVDEHDKMLGRVLGMMRQRFGGG